jgi:8-oxo-dGTP diphosphatase
VPRTHCVDSQVYGAIVISPNGEFLVVQGRQSKKWSFPKGHGRAWEKPLEAALRELKEETGVNLEGVEPLNERRFLSNKSGSGGTYFVFKLEYTPIVEPEDKNEIIGHMWCCASRLPRLSGNMDLTTFCKKRCHLDPKLVG